MVVEREALTQIFLGSATIKVNTALCFVALEEHSFRRHREGRGIARLIGFSLVENLGYRQLLAFWRFVAFFDLARGRDDWGEMNRTGFATIKEAPLPPT